MKNIFCYLMIILCSSCVKDDGPCHDFIEIINDSEFTVYYEVNNEPLVGANPSLSGNYYKILPNSSKNHFYSGENGCYESLFGREDVIYFSFYDAAVVATQDWETIRENDMVLERQSFTLEQINVANWKVILNE